MRPPHVNPLLSPDDIAALAALKERMALARRGPTGLLPWMRLFAVDYALARSSYSKDELLELARRFSNNPQLSRLKLNQVMRRQDFRDLVERFVADTEAAAREKLQAMLPKTLEYVEESIDNARAAKDYKAMPTVVEPVLGRTVPKKEEKEQQTPQVVVNMGAKFAQMFAETAIQDAEVEELPLPREEEDMSQG